MTTTSIWTHDPNRAAWSSHRHSMQERVDAAFPARSSKRITVRKDAGVGGHYVALNPATDEYWTGHSPQYPTSTVKDERPAMTAGGPEASCDVRR